MAVSQNDLEQTQSNFERMISMLGLVANISAKMENESIHLSVKTDDPGRLIGRNGQTLNALQHLLNGILLNKKKKFPRVLIDVEGYQDKRRSAADRAKPGTGKGQILRRALDAAKEVKKWGETVTLSRVNETEYNAVFQELKNDHEIEVVKTERDGSGTYKVIIQLKNQ